MFHLKTNTEISAACLLPCRFHFGKLRQIFLVIQRGHGLRSNSIFYVSIELWFISLLVRIYLAAYAFSRYKFIGDKHMFFWLLQTVWHHQLLFLLPFFQLYFFSGLSIHTLRWHAHCIFTVASSCVDSWRLYEWRASWKIDETAYTMGYLSKILCAYLIPLIRLLRIGVTHFFCFMFSWSRKLLLARTLTWSDCQPIRPLLWRITFGFRMIGFSLRRVCLLFLPGMLVIIFRS